MTKSKNHDNFIKSRRLVTIMKIILGLSVFSPEYDANGKVKSKFNPLGFITFLFWSSLYYYSLCIVISEDQTILRKLYNTRLNHYGDAGEVLVTTALVVYGTYKVPFDLSGNFKCVQCFVNIDKAIEDLGVRIDFKKDVTRFMLLPILEVLVTVVRGITIYNLNLDTSIAFTKMIQMLVHDCIAFVLTTQFCFHLNVLRSRYGIINNILENIQKKESREFVIIRVQKPINGFNLHDVHLCEKVRKCGKICSMLHDTCTVVNKKYGLAIVCTMLDCLALIVLYLYYFMEATASGLFHDPKRYINFIVYVIWVIIYAVFLIYISIFFSERVTKMAKVTAERAHDIINSCIDQSITQEASYLSLQMLHQTPEFSGCGLTNLNYALLLEGTKSIVTFLVIMLQFVTDNRLN